MARLPYLSKEYLAPEDQDLLARDFNLGKLLAYSPNAARSFGQLGMWIRTGSKLNPRLRELAILQVGYVTKCVYEYTHHIQIGRDAGVSDDDIRAIAIETRGDTSQLDEPARLVLRASREMTTDLAMSEATFSALKER